MSRKRRTTVPVNQKAHHPSPATKMPSDKSCWSKSAPTASTTSKAFPNTMSFRRNQRIMSNCPHPSQWPWRPTAQRLSISSSRISATQSWTLWAMLKSHPKTRWSERWRRSRRPYKSCSKQRKNLTSIRKTQAEWKIKKWQVFFSIRRFLHLFEPKWIYKYIVRWKKREWIFLF